MLTFFSLLGFPLGLPINVDINNIYPKSLNGINFNWRAENLNIFDNITATKSMQLVTYNFFKWFMSNVWLHFWFQVCYFLYRVFLLILFRRRLQRPLSIAFSVPERLISLDTIFYTFIKHFVASISKYWNNNNADFKIQFNTN